MVVLDCRPPPATRRRTGGPLSGTPVLTTEAPGGCGGVSAEASGDRGGVSAEARPPGTSSLDALGPTARSVAVAWADESPMNAGAVRRRARPAQRCARAAPLAFWGGGNPRRVTTRGARPPSRGASKGLPSWPPRERPNPPQARLAAPLRRRRTTVVGQQPAAPHGWRHENHDRGVCPARRGCLLRGPVVERRYGLPRP